MIRSFSEVNEDQLKVFKHVMICHNGEFILKENVKNPLVTKVENSLSDMCVYSDDEESYLLDRLSRNYSFCGDSPEELVQNVISRITDKHLMLQIEDNYVDANYKLAKINEFIEKYGGEAPNTMDYVISRIPMGNLKSGMKIWVRQNSEPTEREIRCINDDGVIELVKTDDMYWFTPTNVSPSDIFIGLTEKECAQRMCYDYQMDCNWHKIKIDFFQRLYDNYPKNLQYLINCEKSFKRRD